MIEGLLLVDKPAGVSSFGVVAKVRGVLRAHFGIKNIKVGHTGTLDPAATGLLVLAIGTYTKRVPELLKQDKTYEVTMKLGETSTTGDKEGEITAVSNTQPTEQAVADALQAFTGQIMQTPPAFSAIKVNGQRAYNLARKGKEVVIEPRQVTIYKNELVSYEYPYVRFTSEVGSGTYIRSLVEDIGNMLETGAYMSNLRRTSIGDFSIENAVPLADIMYATIEQNLVTLEN
ncbi:MAG: tRNA pseudouridine(55) synthase TruB [Candidatus Saccharimonadales bacterium]